MIPAGSTLVVQGAKAVAVDACTLMAPGQHGLPDGVKVYPCEKDGNGCFRASSVSLQVSCALDNWACDLHKAADSGPGLHGLVSCRAVNISMQSSGHSSWRI